MKRVVATAHCRNIAEDQLDGEVNSDETYGSTAKRSRNVVVRRTACERDHIKVLHVCECGGRRRSVACVLVRQDGEQERDAIIRMNDKYLKKGGVTVLRSDGLKAYMEVAVRLGAQHECVFHCYEWVDRRGWHSNNSEGLHSSRKRDTAARIQGETDFLEDEGNYLAWCRQHGDRVWPELLMLLKKLYSDGIEPPGIEERPHCLPAEDIVALTPQRRQQYRIVSMHEFE
jgi:hypothetical protein